MIPPHAASANVKHPDAPNPQWSWLAVSVAGYVLFPASIPKFYFLCVGLWLACRVLSQDSTTLLCAGAAATLFATTFLLTPVCAAKSLQLPGMSAGASSVVVQLAFLAFGCVWLRFACCKAPPVLQRMGALRWRFALLWPLLLIGAFTLPWMADIAYGGDEHYHLKSLVVNGTLGFEVLGHGWFTVLLLLWLGRGVWLAIRAGDLQSPSVASKAKGPRVQAASTWAIAALALAACAPLLYPPGFLEDPFNQDRMLRYPGSQPWFSGWLWQLARGNWGASMLFGFEVLRFTPVFAMCVIGMVLVQEKRWRNAPLILPLLAALVVATIPTLLYHGSLLYLELALIPLLVLLVGEGKRWLLASPEQLAGTNAWWSALALGFLKDTGIIAIGILWVTRAVVRGTFLTRRSEWSGQAVLAEARVAFVTLGPGVLYLLLRSLHGSRPYQPHFENFLSSAMWLQATRSVLEQFGFLWLPALAGVWLLARRRAWVQLLAAAALFAGMGLFHLLEEPRWVGLARFNLLLLPAVMVLAWVGFGALLYCRTVAMAALLLLLAGNVLLSPVDRTGQRAVWGGSGERWYDYTYCLSDLRKLKPDARLAMANVPHSYGIGMTLQRLDWWADIENLPVVNPGDAQATLRASLEKGERGKFDFVIFRWEGEPPIATEYEHAGYVRMRDYSSRGGTLTVFARKGLATQTPP